MEKGVKAGQQVCISDQILVCISYHFGVNLNWLKTGDKNMRNTKREELIRQLWMMDEREIEALWKIVESMQMLQKHEREKPHEKHLALVK